jgi:solute carrier family 5 (sodium-coupled monocarboxylate transporter), member 8/12
LANSTVYIQNAGADNSSVHWIFRINYMYYSLIGAILVAVVGYPISILTGGTKNLDPKLLSPLFRRFYKLNLEKCQTELTFIASPEETEKLKSTNN